MAIREIQLADVEIEALRPAGAGDEPDWPDTLIVLLLPRGSLVEPYATAIVEGMIEGDGRIRAVRIDTGREPRAPERFGLNGATGMALLLDGKQVAAFAVPLGGSTGANALQPLLEGIQRAVKGLLPPPAGGGGPAR